MVRFPLISVSSCLEYLYPVEYETFPHEQIELAKSDPKEMGHTFVTNLTGIEGE